MSWMYLQLGNTYLDISIFCMQDRNDETARIAFVHPHCNITVRHLYDYNVIQKSLKVCNRGSFLVEVEVEIFS